MLYLIYADKATGRQIVIGSVLANHRMSIDDILELLEIDIDKWAADRGWDYDEMSIVKEDKYMKQIIVTTYTDEPEYKLYTQLNGEVIALETAGEAILDESEIEEITDKLHVNTEELVEISSFDDIWAVSSCSIRDVLINLLSDEQMEQLARHSSDSVLLAVLDSAYSWADRQVAPVMRDLCDRYDVEYNEESDCEVIFDRLNELVGEE